MIRCDTVAKDMWVTTDKLLVYSPNHIVDVEGPLVCAYLRVEGDLLEHVAKLLGEVSVIMK